MAIPLGILKTRVARRVLFLFFLCAFLPVLALTVISYYSVRGQLLDESRGILGDMAKNAGLALTERLQFLERAARVAAVPLAWEGASGSPIGWQDSQEGRGEFEAAVLINGEGDSQALFGEMPVPAEPDSEEMTHLLDGFALVRALHQGDGSPEILMGLSVGEAGGPPALLWARIRLDSLWSTAQGYSTLPNTAGICVQEQTGRPLLCTVPDPGRFLEAAPPPGRQDRGTATARPYTVFEWTDEQGEVYLAATRFVFLKPQFFLPGLTVSVSQTRSSALAELQTFRTAFLGVMVMSLVVVALLANVQIRKSLGPLSELHNGTRRVAEGEFGSRVEVASGDEFEELADSFNSMAQRLQVQFQALETIGEIDRAILSALESEKVIETALEGTRDLLPCERAAVCRLDWLGSREGRLRVVSAGEGPVGPPLKVHLSADDLALLGEAEVPTLLEDSGLAHAFLGEDPEEGRSSVTLLAPLRLQEGLVGYAAVLAEAEAGFSSADEDHFRQVAEQLSVALANARLLEELERMSWGALTALARTIDAKSPWTSGHSERVTSLAVAFGRAMGLDDAAVEDLQRGGLVHDIGKLAVPPEILDKTGKLTPEEWTVIQSHPEEGVRILEPIPALEGILPMVLHHHESWDGSGYPSGLAGEDIPFQARVLAVADRFDAVTSERPYRKGASVEDSLEWIRSEAGRGLDPDLAHRFIEFAESGELPLPRRKIEEMSA
jgi:HD-GYP domain-containing protein (c-di-GMP phosphodiesterase class II)/HAMP domain-containing protein